MRNRRLLLRKASVALRRTLLGPSCVRGTIKMGNVIFPFQRDLDPRMEMLYYGAYEPEVAVLLEKFLFRGMTFIDVGANIGYFSALALDRVGKSGSIHAFEPVPCLCNRLKELARLNPTYRMECNNFALGDTYEQRALDMCGHANIGWNTLVPGLMPPSELKESRTVCVRRLDDYLLEENIRDVSLMKIDVEGYEFPVLRGTQKFFEITECRPRIICEIAPEAYGRLGTSLTSLKVFMQKLGYASYDGTTLKRLDVSTLSETTNVLFSPVVS